MAFADISIVSPGGQNLPPAVPFRVEAGATAILVGEPVKIGGTGNNFVIPSADAEPVTTSATFVGIAATNSNPLESAPYTATTLVNGFIDVQVPCDGMIFQAKALNPVAVNTTAKILALANKLVVLDFTAGVYTVGTVATAVTDGLIIVGGDPENGTVTFMVRESCTFFN